MPKRNRTRPAPARRGAPPAAPVVPAPRGSGAPWFRRPVVPAPRGSGAPWFRRPVVPAPGGSGAPCFGRPVVPAPRGSGAPWFRRPVVPAPWLRWRRGYAGVVGRNAGRQVASRDADRQQVPAPMRRDVRLLGDLLGEVLLESGGQGLLADVERLRRSVIAARRADPRPSGDDSPATSTGGASSASSAGPSPESGAALREIAEMVAAWPLERAEAVAHPFTA